MFIQEIQSCADNEIVERFTGGFVGRFMDHCHCVTGPYTRLIAGKVKTKDDGKLFITFSDQYSLPSPDDPCLPMRIKWPFEFSRYVTADTYSKKLAILEGVHESCLWTLRRNEWDTEPFTAAKQTLLDAKLEWTDISRTQWVHPNKRIKVRIGMKLDLSQFSLFLIVYEIHTESEHTRIPIREYRPCENWDHIYMKRAKWLTPMKFEINTSGSRPILVDIPESVLR